MPAMNQPLPVMNPWEQSHLGFHCEQTGSTRVRTQSSVGAHPSLLHGQGQKLATLALQPSSFLSPLLTSCFTWEWSPMHLCSTPHSHARSKSLRQHPYPSHPMPRCPFSLQRHCISRSLSQASRPWLPQALLRSPTRLT